VLFGAAHAAILAVPQTTRLAADEALALGGGLRFGRCVGFAKLSSFFFCLENELDITELSGIYAVDVGRGRTTNGGNPVVRGDRMVNTPRLKHTLEDLVARHGVKGIARETKTLRAQPGPAHRQVT